MRIIINIDAVKDPDRIGKKTVRVRTGYYFSSGDELSRIAASKSTTSSKRASGAALRAGLSFTKGRRNEYLH